MNNNYSVYIHIFPNNKIYVGMTKQIPKYRWRNKNFHYNQNMINAIQEYGWENVKHKILYEHLTKEEAEQKEIELIAQYKSNQREYGYNLDSGGLIGFKRSKETLEKNSIKRKGKKPACSFLGRKHSEETKLKMSQKRTGMKRSLEAILKTAKAKEIKVTQYDLENKIIKTWDSITIASKTLHIKDSDISRVCKGYRKTAGGYIWRYANEL